MSRRASGADRAVLAVLGLVLLAAGAATAAWGLGQLEQLVPGAPAQLSTQGAQGVLQAPWWGAALLVAGVVLAVAGLRWLAAHLPGRSSADLALRPSGEAGGPGGRDQLDGGAATTVLAEVLSRAPGVRSADGRLVEERGRLVAEVRAVLEPWADLTSVAAAADAAAGELRRTSGRDDVLSRVRLRVARRARSGERELV